MKINGSQLYRILMALYNAGESAGRGNPLPGEPVQYAAKKIKELLEDEA